MKCLFAVGASERTMLGMLSFLDKKYPSHAQHMLVGWHRILDARFIEEYWFICSCGENVILTFAEAIAFEKKPLDS